MRNILDTIGSSPLVSLPNLLKDRFCAEVCLKLERMNPGGSVKDRSALHIVQQAERADLLRPGATIIESSSGNFGIALAMIGAARGYKVIILVDPKTTETNKALMRAYGADVIVVTEQDDSGSYHKTRIALANKLHREIPNSFRPDQCFNSLNSDAHYRFTAPELYRQCASRLDAVVLPVSTGGLAGGIARFFQRHAPEVKLVAVEPVGSTIFGGQAHPYLLPGMGLSWTPTNLDDLGSLDEVYKISDDDAFLACRVLARHEGVLAGGSTGAALLVALKLAMSLSAGRRVVVVAADGGDRYLNTIYNPEWLCSKGLSQDAALSRLLDRVRGLTVYSATPEKCANYQPELAAALDSPSTAHLQFPV